MLHMHMNAQCLTGEGSNFTHEVLLEHGAIALSASYPGLCLLLLRFPNHAPIALVSSLPGEEELQSRI